MTSEPEKDTGKDPDGVPADGRPTPRTASDQPESAGSSGVKSGEKSNEKAGETAQPTRAFAEGTLDDTKRTEEAPAKRVDNTATKPVDTTATKPVDTTATKPVDNTATKPVDTTTTKPADTTTTKPVDTKRTDTPRTASSGGATKAEAEVPVAPEPAADGIADTRDSRRDELDGERRTERAERLRSERTDDRRRSLTELELARAHNRRLTDLGLLVLRLLPLLLLIRSYGKVSNFGAFRDMVAQSPFGQPAPDLIAIVQVAAEVALPIALFLGVLTRLSGLLLAANMGFIWVAFHLFGSGPVLGDQSQIMGEAALVFFLAGLALLLTGAGRFSIDYLVMRKRVRARAERRAGKHV